MKQSALNHASGRLRLAETAFASMCKPGFEDQFQVHWLDFLVQWKGAYMKVQQAAKDTPQEIQWFGDVNRERKADPLLRYLYEARNDGEHGIDDSARHSGVKYTGKTFGTWFKLLTNEDDSLLLNAEGKPTIIDQNGEVKEIEVTAPESRLVEVKEFDGKRVVPPPTSHLGQAMEPKPHIAAALGLKWLRDLVAVATAMSKP